MKLLAGACLAIAAILAGCATQQATMIPIGSERLPPKPSSAAVDVFREDQPERPFREIGILNVHLERTGLVPPSLDAALEQLKDLARAHGADAIIRLNEERSLLNETRILNLSGVAIAYVD